MTFWSKVERRGPNECWPWAGADNGQGYGRTHMDGRRTYAHRVAYILSVGPVPPGLHVDHLCHGWDTDCPGGSTCPHRRCVNPGHLEAVPQRTNLLRGRGVSTRAAVKTHCVRGHAF